MLLLEPVQMVVTVVAVRVVAIVGAWICVASLVRQRRGVVADRQRRVDIERRFEVVGPSRAVLSRASGGVQPITQWTVAAATAVTSSKLASTRCTGQWRLDDDLIL